MERETAYLAVTLKDASVTELCTYGDVAELLEIASSEAQYCLDELGVASNDAFVIVPREADDLELRCALWDCVRGSGLPFNDADRVLNSIIEWHHAHASLEADYARSLDDRLERLEADASHETDAFELLAELHAQDELRNEADDINRESQELAAYYLRMSREQQLVVRDAIRAWPNPQKPR